MPRSLDDREDARRSNVQKNRRNTRWTALFAFTSRSHLPILSCAIVTGALTGGIVPSFAFLLGRVFDGFAKFGGGMLNVDNFVAEVNSNITHLVILGAVGVVLNIAFLLAWTIFGDRQAQSGRDVLFDCIMGKPVSWYDIQSPGVAATLHKFQKQLRELQTALTQPLGLLIQYLITCLAALVLALCNSWDLTLVCLASIPIGLVVLAFILGKLQPAMERQTEYLTIATRQVKSIIDSIDVVKSFDGQYEEANKYLATIESAATCYRRQVWWNAAQIGFIRLLTRSLFVQGFWYGSHLVHDGRRTSGQILTAFWGCLMATQTFEQILPQLLMLERGRSAVEDLGSFVRTGTSNGAAEEEYVPRMCEGHVKMVNVKFAYPSQLRTWSLMNVSMNFAAGKTTYVVGRSGSGKSTMASLLMRHYDSFEGEISIDGNPIDLLSIDWLRHNVTVVSQDNILFNDTLLKNIAFGRNDSNEVRRTLLDQSVRLSSLSEVINALPQGLKTLLGPGGTNLSGGQAQRVSIARARIRDSPVVILDEATSALDPATSRSVMQRILRWRKDRTTIVITHEISQVGPDDYMYILDKGRVVQRGYRNEMERQGQESPFAGLAKAAGMPLSPQAPPKCYLPRPENFGMRDNGGQPFNVNASDPFANPFTARRLHHKESSGPSESNSSASAHLLRRPSLRFAMPALSLASSHLSVVRHSMAFPHTMEDSISTTSDSEIEPTSPLVNVAGEIAQYCRAVSSWQERRRISAGIELERVESKGTAAAEESNAQDEQGRKRNAQPALSMSKILLTVWPRLGTRYRAYCCVGAFSAAVHATCTPIFSWVFARLLATYYQPSKGSDEALKLSLSLLGISAVDAAASFLTHYLLEHAAQAWVDDIRFDVMRRILHQPKTWFDSEEARPGDLVDQLNRGAEEIRSLLGRFAGYLFIALVMMVVGLCWCLVVSWKLTLLGVSTAPVMYSLTAAFDKVSANWESKCSRSYQTAFGMLLEVAEKIRTVRAFCLQRHFRDKHLVASEKAFEMGIRRAVYSGVLFGLSDGCIFFVVALVFWYGSHLVSVGEQEVSSMLTVFSMLLFVISNVNAIVAFMPQLGSARGVATGLLRLTQLPSIDNHEHLGDMRIADLPGSIWFRDVRFRYSSRPDQPALDGATFEIARGISTGLVGSSGSGKSTVVALLLRLYSLSAPAGSGSLKIGNVPLTQLDVNSWRAMAAYVPQQPNIFPGTFSENIAYGLSVRSPYRNDNLVRNAATVCGLSEFIASLPDGFETLIGEGGMGLSGGQKQKLAIARALIRRPRVLILDEPTSALDATSAEEVRQLLRSLVEGERMTVLVVTHSVAMMKTMDRLVVLRKGKVVHKGVYEDLVKADGELGRLAGIG